MPERSGKSIRQYRLTLYAVFLTLFLFLFMSLRATETRPLGPAIDYKPTSISSEELSKELNTSMRKRRRFGWEVLKKSLRPVEVQSPKRSIPLWQTWYDREEVQGMLKSGIKKYQAKSSNKGLPKHLVNKVLADHDASREGINKSSYGAQIKFFGKKGVPGFSPSFVRHLLENYKSVAACNFDTKPELDLMEKKSFSQCMAEFPAEAVMIKAAWRLVRTPSKPCRIEYFDYSGDSWLNAYKALNRRDLSKPTPVFPFLQLSRLIPTQPKIDDGECGKSTLSKKTQVRGRYRSIPDSSQIFTMESRSSSGKENERWALAALHIVTKEVREWVWASFHWSPTHLRNLDLGKDRPADLPPPWNHYKLSIVTGFEEEDPKPWIGADGRSIETLKKIYQVRKRWADLSDEFSYTQWSSNPYLEVGDPDSNCIGCHQSPLSLFKGVYGSQRFRKNFPADFSFQMIDFDGNADFQRYIKEGMGHSSFSVNANKAASLRSQ